MVVPDDLPCRWLTSSDLFIVLFPGWLMSKDSLLGRLERQEFQIPAYCLLAAIWTQTSAVEQISRLIEVTIEITTIFSSDLLYSSVS